MLHKTDNLIMADCILRLLRLEKKLKHIDGIIKPYMDTIEQGFTIELLKYSCGDIISFAVDENGQIIVYIYDSALELLDDDFQTKKIYSSENFVAAKEYITNAILTLIKNAKIKFPPVDRYNAL